MSDLKFEDGYWQVANPEPYYPNWFEKLIHKLGKHLYYKTDHCVICNKLKIDKNAGF